MSQAMRELFLFVLVQIIVVLHLRHVNLNETMILSSLNLNVKQSELFLTDVRLGCWKGLTGVGVDEVLQQFHISVVQDQVFVPAYRTRAPSADSALSDASLPSLRSKLPLVVSSVLHPQRLIPISFLESHTLHIFHRRLNRNLTSSILGIEVLGKKILFRIGFLHFFITFLSF